MLSRTFAQRGAQRGLFAYWDILRRYGNISEGWQKWANRSHDTNESVFSRLVARGSVNQIIGTEEEFIATQRRNVGVYLGLDPTSDSLHLGHLVPLITLAQFYASGYLVILVIGTGTGRVGDPTGRIFERAELPRDICQANAQSINEQVIQIFQNVDKRLNKINPKSTSTGDRHLGKYIVRYNDEWLDKAFNLTTLLRLGPAFRVNTLLGRIAAKSRMESDGLSLSEMMYPMLQALDWKHLYCQYGAQIQIGGKDQFGNMVSGADAINFALKHNMLEGDIPRSDQGEVLRPLGLTVPLLTSGSGEKFGKSGGNAVWLKPRKTSVFNLYGYMASTADNLVEQYLNIMTLLPMDEITRIMRLHEIKRSKRLAQHCLAREIINIIHGEAAGEAAQKMHETIFNSPTVQLVSELAESSVNGSEGIVKSIERRRFCKLNAARIFRDVGLAESASEATNLIQARGAYFGHVVDEDRDRIEFQVIQKAEDSLVECCVHRNLAILRAGKKRICIVKIVDSMEEMN